MPANPISAGRVQLGVIGRAHGVRGLVKITSYTTDPADLAAYGPLSDGEGRLYVVCWKAEGVAEVARIVDGVTVKVTDRSQAERLTNIKLFIDRAALPAPDHDEYYLTDLINLTVVDTAGGTIGIVAAVHDYGAGASIEVIGPGAPILIPFTVACVPTVDLAERRLVAVLPDEIIVPEEADVVMPNEHEALRSSQAEEARA